MDVRGLVLLALLGGAPLLRAQSAPALREGEGYVNVPGGRIWYRVVGHGTKTPLLVVHGCCVGSYYLEPLAKLADDRPVVFYDQLDNGRSDHPGDSTNWRLPRFVDEIVRLRAALGLEEIHLYGHGWGATVAAEYMLTKPRGVRSLILASPQLAMWRYPVDIGRLFDALSPPVQRALVRHERDGTESSPEYRQALSIFQHEYLSRHDPWRASLDSSRAHANAAMKRYLFGPGILDVTGSMRGYDRSLALGAITAPTLIAIGRYGYTSIGSASYYHNMIPGSLMMLFESSGELAMQDEPEWYVSVLRSFTNRADSIARSTLH
jgi:proline iminopeptidase